MYNLRKLWEKTGDVEKLRSRAGRGKSLDESAANEFTKDRKFGWSMVGCPAVKERDFRRSERWSILPAYTKDGYMAWKIFQGSYTKQIFN